MKAFILNTTRLHIRKLTLSDLSDFHDYRSNPDVAKYQGFDVYTLQKAKAFIQEQENKVFGKAGQWTQYGLEEKATQKIIGDCAIKLHKQDTRIAEVGVTISHRAQQQGFAKEALVAILSYLFDVQKVHRVVEIMDAENIGAIQLMESIGFRQEGHFIENIFFKGKWGSEYQYALLKREWDDGFGL